jgi:poly(A) polymerase
MLKNKMASHVVEIIAMLQNAGYEAYVVGGAVRDSLLGRKPKDYDISTSATPEEVKRVFRKFRCFIIGRRFRLVHLYYGKHDIVEISTFRAAPAKEIQKHPKKGKHTPKNMIFQDNEYGSAEEDAWRRDFTVNALFYDPVKGKMVDFTGKGLEDCRNGIVRTIGKSAYVRFQEDPVRTLRALKLVGQYGFTLDPDTEKDLTKALPLLKHISPARLSLELEKIMKAAYGHLIIKACHDYGLLTYFLPFLEKNWETPACEQALKLLEVRNRRMSNGLYRDSLSLAFAVLALPFIEEKYGNGVGNSWEDYEGIHFDIRRLLLEIIKPQVVIKKLSGASVLMLTLQPTLLSKIASKRILSHRGYPHGRELLFIQNELMWNDDEFETFYTPPVQRKRRSRGYKKKWYKDRDHHNSDKKRGSK